MTEYEQIKSALAPVLEKGGIMQIEEELEPDVFGSAYSVFSGKGLSYRIIWDGKDGCGYIQVSENDCWVNLKASAPETNHGAFESALIRMRIALVEHKALKKLNV